MEGAEDNCTEIATDYKKSNGAANKKPLAVNGMPFYKMQFKYMEEKAGKKLATKCLPGRTDTQCLHRWQKVLNPNLIKGPWSKEEDNLLITLVEKQSGKKMKWSEIAAQLPSRMGKQCRERWHNHLNPEINKAAWTKEEEKILISAHSIYGNKWSEIAKILPGRTENSVKNQWNCSLKRKLINSSVNYHPPHENEKCEDKLVEIEQTRTSPPNSSYEEKTNDEKNEDSVCLDLSLACPGSSSTFSNHSSSIKPSCGKNIDKSPLDYPDFSSSCSIKPRRHSDTYENLKRHQNSSDWNYYTGLCYEPIWKDDMHFLKSTGGKFMSSEFCIRQPNNEMEVSPDINSCPESILRSAARNYDNVPSIIRKRVVRISRSVNNTNGNTREEEEDDDDDRVQSNGLKDVGKSLEQAFSDA
ncbi:Myb-like protein [Striga asiatica]|uniref:Myb-like protein n=1 Tax=Striga asiatica TaxID=4170 RepID=A0A5A7RJM7_STRAF|nr:Myb-like protein [Striga asiatica]